MIVTCEKCSARYKLDDAKVTGRGAKITCPRCRHVFIVYREGAVHPPTQTPTVLPEHDSIPPSSRELIGSSVTLPGGSRNNRPAPLPASQPPPTPAPLPPPAPVYAPPPPAQLAPPPAQPARGRRDVHALDFRKVGIASWKVRVKIGLIYDFSDYKTLRKYIQDGRVTASDLISHDGKGWIPIGDIPDLEMYFIEVYEEAERKKEREERRGGSENPFEDESPTAVVGMSELAASTLAGSLASEQKATTTLTPTSPVGRAAPSAAPVGGTRGGSKTIPPINDGPARPRARTGGTIPPVPREEKPARSGLGTGGIVVLVLALALAGGWAWLNFFRQPPEPPRPELSTPPPTTTAPSAPDPESVREKVNEELQRELESAGPAEPLNVGPEQPQLIPVKPKDRPRNPSVGLTPAPMTTTQPSSPATTTTAAATATSSAADNAAVGDDAWRRSDYKTAAKAYGTAASMEPGNATYQGKLGRALYKTGDLNGASAALARAGSGGWAEASKWRGHIARDQGDKPGATGFYYEYLKSSPPDAADIQREIDKLNGS